MDQFDINSFIQIKGVSFVIALVFIQIMLFIARFTGVQKYVLPFFDEISQIADEVKSGQADGATKLGLCVAHSVGLLAVLLSAAIMSGVAH